MRIISLDALKGALGSTVSDTDDARLLRLIESYSAQFEREMGARKLENGTHQQELYGFVGRHNLFRLPVQTFPAPVLEVHHEDGTQTDTIRNPDESVWEIADALGELIIHTPIMRLVRSRNDWLVIKYAGGYAADVNTGALIFPPGDTLGDAVTQAMLDQCRTHWRHRDSLLSNAVVTPNASASIETSPTALQIGVKRTLEAFYIPPELGV